MKKDKIQLSDHFTYRRLLAFTLPSIGMTIFTSIYGTIDGLFVSNFVGKSAFASINLIMPYWQILGGAGAMLGVGGSALVSKTLGEKNTERACRYFTMITYVMAIIGIIFGLIGMTTIRPVAYLLGATDAMIGDCQLYGRIVFAFLPAMLAQYTFQGFAVTAEKPTLGLFVTVAAGVTNIALDALLVAGIKLGVAGAAIATGMSMLIGGLIPIIWFLSSANKSHLHFKKTRIEMRPILKACTNGVSEMLSSVSGSIIGMLYNLQLMKYAGADGVAAYGVVMYAAFVFISVFMGYASGSAPIVSYHYGAGDRKELKSLLKKGLIIEETAGIVLTIMSIAAAGIIARIFVGYDAELMAMTIRAYRICSLPFLIMGASMFISSYFTALNDGLVSAEISVLRSMILPAVCIIIMPMVWKLDGVWYSLVSSEVGALIVASGFLLKNRKKYGYM